MAEQTRRTTPKTSNDTIELINEKVIPVLYEVQSDIKLINNRLDDIEKHNCSADEIVSMLRKTIYGNGDIEKGGLITSVSKLRDWVETRSSIEKAIVITFITAVLGEILGFIVIAIKIASLS
jgi:cell division protein FtsL